LRALCEPELAGAPAYALLSPKVSPHREAIRTLGEWLKGAGSDGA
jgi:hypothetical protein